MPQNKLKIAFLQKGNDPYTNERIKFFQSKGHQVFSISFFQEKPDNQINEVDYFTLRKCLIDKIYLGKRISHYFELKRILKLINPDIFHVVSALNLIYCNYALQLKKIIENQGSDLILSPQKYKFLIPFYRRFFPKVNAVIQDSKLLLEKSIQYGAPDDPAINKVIEIGVDFNVFNPEIEKDVIRKRYALKKKPVLLHTRGNNPLYNLDIILNSLTIIREKIPEIVLILTTSFDDLNLQNRKFIVSNNLANNIIFVGFQDRIKELKYFYMDADLVISVPSSDSSPFSVYESLACKTPVIVSDLPWLYSKFSPGKHLIVVPPRNSKELAQKIISYFTNSLTENIDIDSAFQVVKKEINFSIENAKLENLYLKLIEK